MMLERDDRISLTTGKVFSSSSARNDGLSVFLTMESSNVLYVECYIGSSGRKEVIGGISMAKYFRQMYACSFFYDQNDTAIRSAVLLTTRQRHNPYVGLIKV